MMLHRTELPILLASLFISITALGQEASRLWTNEDRQYLLSELDRTTAAIMEETSQLDSQQWYYRYALGSWSIGEIVEHLEMQNLLHYREITVMAMAPENTDLLHLTRVNDAYFSAYAKDPTPSDAKWFLVPRGRYKTSREGTVAFALARSELRKFVSETQVDLRRKVTYRVNVHQSKKEDINLGGVRDLHQLLLTGLAHTERHLTQIKKIKAAKDFPK